MMTKKMKLPDILKDFGTTFRLNESKVSSGRLGAPPYAAI